MEFFLPGLLLFLVAIVCTYFLAPHVTPMIAAVLSMAFLIYGVYDHSRLFASEYRLSTWQETLKIYSPFLMIGAIILYLIFGMVSIFSGISVPSLPNVSMPTVSMPNVSLPNMGSSLNSATNQLSKSYNNMTQSLTNVANSISNTASNMGNSISNYYNRNANQNSTSMKNTSVKNLGERF
jgi:predicted PurR-regulated permease PerM